MSKFGMNINQAIAHLENEQHFLCRGYDDITKGNKHVRAGCTVVAALNAAYAELEKQEPVIDAVFDQDVWEAMRLSPHYGEPPKG